MSEANTPFFCPSLHDTASIHSCLSILLVLLDTPLRNGYMVDIMGQRSYAPPPPPSFFLQTTVGNAEVKPLEEHVHAVRLLSAWLYQKYIYRVSSTRWLEWLL